MSETTQRNDVNHGIAETVNSQPRPGETRDCLDPWYQPFIRTNGEVWPCCWFYEELGNVNETPFHQLVNGAAFRQLRRELLTGQLRKACIECPSRSTTTPPDLLARLRSSVIRKAKVLDLQVAGGGDVELAPDIVEPGRELRLGRNWHDLKSQAGEFFRWVENNAEIVLNATPNSGEMLQLELEAGPSFGGKPAPIQVVDEDGGVLLEVEVLGRQTLRSKCCRLFTANACFVCKLLAGVYQFQTTLGF